MKAAVAVLDERGRLFGRWNLIDAAAFGAVALVILLGYGAFVLFRSPVPIVVSITPAQIFAQQTGTLELAGERLRPFLQVRLDCGQRAATCESFTTPLLVASPTSAELNVTDLTPGTYDFVLLDEARELVRVPNAITVLPSARPALTQMDVQAVGAFVFLTASDASRVSTGTSLDEEFKPGSVVARPGAAPPAPVGRVLAVLPPEVSTQRLRVSEAVVVTTPVPDKLQVPAIVRFRCLVTIDRCRISGVDVLKDALVPLAVSVPQSEKFTHPVTHLVFRIDEVRPATAPLTFPTADAVVRVKFVAKPEVAGLPMAGDEDFGVPVAEGPEDARRNARSLRAAIVSVDTQPQTVVATTLVGPTTFQETMATFEATLKVPVVLTSTGWQYADRPVKVGAPFKFEGRTYAMDGWVIALRLGADARSGRGLARD